MYAANRKEKLLCRAIIPFFFVIHEAIKLQEAIQKTIKEEYKVDEFFGEVISRYSRAQALEDGVLVDLNKAGNIPISESGYKYPIACTASVWEIIEVAVSNPKFSNYLSGVIWDIIFMSRAYPVKRWETGQLFKVNIKVFHPKDVFTFKIECGPGDEGEPVLTIMLEDED